VVAFVFGLLFFVPFVTQAIALVSGAIAVLRPRRPHERVIIAWIGIVISGLALLGWFAFGRTILGSARTAAFWGAPVYMPADDDARYGVGELADWVDRIYAAAAADHRDFARWPVRIEDLAGRLLPRDFTMPEGLTYRRPPTSQQRSTTWVLIVSDDVYYDLDGQELDQPHRLIGRLGGKVELRPSEEVQALLDSQNTNE
jgi:hypothetical protein